MNSELRCNWVKCFYCNRQHLAEVPCLNREQMRLLINAPCAWVNNVPYLFHECGNKDLKVAEEEMWKRIPNAPEDTNLGTNDSVNHPKHYQGNKFEVIEIIEDFNLDFDLGNAIKYILRCGKKGNLVQDLKKAIWYLQRRVEMSGGDRHE